MKYILSVAGLAVSLLAPMPARAQADLRISPALVSLEVAASAFGRRVLLELGLSLDVLWDWADERGDARPEGSADRAERVRQSRRWSRAADQWQQVLFDDDSTPAHWSAYGDALAREGRHREAIAAFQRAMQLGVDRPGDAAMGVARGYARLGNRKQALRWVERARELGSSQAVQD